MLHHCQNMYGNLDIVSQIFEYANHHELNEIIFYLLMFYIYNV